MTASRHLIKLPRNDCDLEFAQVPAGSYVMGSSNDFYGEVPPRRVSVAHPFLIGTQLVTQAQWSLVMEQNPSRFALSPAHPVDSFSWLAATEFCSRLSEMCGLLIRLPTESEWEYACRAGSEGEYFFRGEDSIADETEVPSEAKQALAQYAWFDLNSRGHTHEVGLKLPNPWGLYDIVGNLWEWCEDSWFGDYYGAPHDSSARVKAGARLRCLRGGAWDMNAFRCRSTYRSYDREDVGTDRFGLRLVASLLT